LKNLTKKSEIGKRVRTETNYSEADLAERAKNGGLNKSIDNDYSEGSNNGSDSDSDKEVEGAGKMKKIHWEGAFTKNETKNLYSTLFAHGYINFDSIVKHKTEQHHTNDEVKRMLWSLVLLQLLDGSDQEAEKSLKKNVEKENQIKLKLEEKQIKDRQIAEVQLEMGAAMDATDAAPPPQQPPQTQTPDVVDLTHSSTEDPLPLRTGPTVDEIFAEFSSEWKLNKHWLTSVFADAVEFSKSEEGKKVVKEHEEAADAVEKASTSDSTTMEVYSDKAAKISFSNIDFTNESQVFEIAKLLSTVLGFKSIGKDKEFRRSKGYYWKKNFARQREHCALAEFAIAVVAGKSVLLDVRNPLGGRTPKLPHEKWNKNHDKVLLLACATHGLSEHHYQHPHDAIEKDQSLDWGCPFSLEVEKKEEEEGEGEETAEKKKEREKEEEKELEKLAMEKADIQTIKDRAESILILKTADIEEMKEVKALLDDAMKLGDKELANKKKTKKDKNVAADINIDFKVVPLPEWKPLMARVSKLLSPIIDNMMKCVSPIVPVAQSMFTGDVAASPSKSSTPTPTPTPTGSPTTTTTTLTTPWTTTKTTILNFDDVKNTLLKLYMSLAIKTNTKVSVKNKMFKLLLTLILEEIDVRIGECEEVSERAKRAFWVNSLGSPCGSIR